MSDHKHDTFSNNDKWCTNNNFIVRPPTLDLIYIFKQLKWPSQIYQSSAIPLIRKAKLIRCDEAFMAKCQTIETIGRSSRDILNVNELFWWKINGLGGDFCQILSVVSKSTKGEVVKVNLPKLYLWPQMKKIQLIRNIK